MPRLITAARWPFGIALTSWAYLWRTTPMHRSEVRGSLREDAPPPVAPDVSLDGVQRPSHGAGNLLHRTYSGRFRDSRVAPQELIATIRDDPNQVAPGEFTHFHKVDGEGRLDVGDDYVVRMPGPWNGPVRVVHVTPQSFRFATLDGHLEAGQIEWRAFRGRDGMLVFEVESWARAGDRVSALLHGRLRMAKEVQLHMWTSVVERVGKLVGGRLTGGIAIETHYVDAETAATLA